MNHDDRHHENELARLFMQAMPHIIELSAARRRRTEASTEIAEHHHRLEHRRMFWEAVYLRARATLPHEDAARDADEAIIAWDERFHLRSQAIEDLAH